MAPPNIYTNAKHDLSCVVYWVIRTSNSIINQAGEEWDTDDCGPLPELNTTGEITAADLVARCKLIPEHLSSVPPVIFHLLESVIDAHAATHTILQQVATKDPDPKIDRSHETHKRFIDDLFEAFCALGGEDWMPDESKDMGADIEALHDRDEIDRLLLENQFADLSLGGADDDDQGAEESQGGTPGDGSGQQRSGSMSQKRRQARPGKGKRGRWAQKLKKQHKAAAKKGSLSNIPLQDCCIVQDTLEPISPDYLLAVYTLVHQWVDIRAYVQGQWHCCAYDGLNSAVAGGVSNSAIHMVRQAWLDTVADFPGQDSFEFLVSVLTRGNPQEAHGKLSPLSDQLSPGSENADKVQERAVDVKELFMLHTFGDLVDFVEDFQKTRSGKPTKRMLKDIRDWDPELDLWEASEEERIRWRRAYTINWLYDLVNFFLSTIVQEGAKKGETVALEDIDCSLEGPWRDHWGLLGLNKFARLVTSLAMQRQGTKFRAKILPPDVFQLQCIVDSFMVSRGWTISPLKGHVLNPPAWNFQPRRDLDCFMGGGEDQSPDKGLIPAVNAILERINQDMTLYPNADSWKETRVLLGTLLFSFRDFFKLPEYMDGLPSHPPSRFLSRSTNGLWEYSPFLCGIGLMEGLNLAYLTCMQLWDSQNEPTLLVHLHNMLVKRGYLKQPVALFAHIERLFQFAMFLEGVVPSCDFAQALRMQAEAAAPRTALLEQHGANTPANAEFNGRQIVMLVERNRFFRAKSNLLFYREADWSIDAIPDAELPLSSTLLALRLAQSKKVWDPALSAWRFEETDLIRRVKARGVTDQFLRELASVAAEHSASGLTPHEQLMSDDLIQILQKLATAWRVHPSVESQPSVQVATKQPQAAQHAENSSYRKGKEASKRLLLACAMSDFYDDVSGPIRPLSSLNYAAILAKMVDQFKAFEDELRARRNDLYVLLYEQQFTGTTRTAAKRFELTHFALLGENEECLRVMADSFERTWGGGVASYTYWQNSQPFEPTEIWEEEKEDIGAKACSVM